MRVGLVLSSAVAETDFVLCVCVNQGVCVPLQPGELR